MDINICNQNFLNCNIKTIKDKLAKTNQNKKRELFINFFIKKFPKVKLHTIIKVNKYYSDNLKKDNCDMDNFYNKTINYYLTFCNID